MKRIPIHPNNKTIYLFVSICFFFLLPEAEYRINICNVQKMVDYKIILFIHIKMLNKVGHSFHPSLYL